MEEGTRIESNIASSFDPLLHYIFFLFRDRNKKVTVPTEGKGMKIKSYFGLTDRYVPTNLQTKDRVAARVAHFCKRD